MLKYLSGAIFALLLLTCAAPAAAVDLAAVQQRLNEIGFDVGTPDGKLGSRTKYAIEAFQGSHGLSVTGQLTHADLDVLFSDKAKLTAAAPVSGSDFEVLPDTDIPYGDYRSGKEDPGLKGISLEQCQSVCQGEGQCQAFTYNQKYKFCFLKDKVSGQVAFKGAISGRRLATGAIATADTTSPMGLVGAPAGCPAQIAVIDRLRHDMTLSIDATSAVVGDGKGVTLRWHRGDFPERLPVFLMVSTPATVRFAGKNFYALTPGGKAAFGFKQFDGTTRAVVPLFGAGVPQDGTIRVDPLAEGQLDLKWDVVGMTDCGEQANPAPAELQVAVDAGAPGIIFQNPFSTQVPKERIGSPAGDRTIDAFDGYYRLYDKNGYLVAELPGDKPRFSPTGRFVSAWTGDTDITLFDSVDGAALNVLTQNQALGWDNADSFFVGSQWSWDITDFGSALANNGDGRSVGYSCLTCSSVQDGMRFDLANNLILIRDGAASLTSDFQETVDRTQPQSTQAANLQMILAKIRSYSQTAKIVLPPYNDSAFNWQFDGDHPITALNGDLHPSSQDSELETFERAHVLAAKFLPASPPNVGAKGDATETQTAMRGPGRVFPPAQMSGLMHVLDALPELSFATETLAPLTTPALKLIKRAETEQYFEFPGHEHFKLVAPSDAVFPCPADSEMHDADAPILGWDFATLPLHSTDRFTIASTSCMEGMLRKMKSSTLLIDQHQPDKLVDLSPVFATDGSGRQLCQHMLGDCDLTIKVFDDRFVVFFSQQSNALAVYDGDRHKLIASLAAVPRSRFATDLAIDKTGRWLVLYFPGDLFTLLDLSKDQHPNAEHVIDLAHASDPIALEGMVADNELIVWTNKLGFDATAEGAEFVSVRFAGRSDVYALTQFEAALRQKDLLGEITGGAAPADPTHRIAPPPALASTRVNLDSAGTTLDIGLAWGNTPLSKLTVLQDGLVTDTLDLSQKVGATSFTTPRVRGAKWVTLLAQDDAGVASRPYSTELPADPRGNRPLRVVAVGIDRYDDPQLPSLPLARPDAGNIDKAFAALPSVTLASAETLVDDATTSGAIRAAIGSAVAASAADDTLVLSFSGHGISDDAGNLYLATRDTRLNDIAHTALPWSDIAGMIAKAKGRVVVFLDTCHSGIAGTAYAAPSEGAVEDFLTAIPSNLLIFSASKGREFSQEQAALGGGVFTNALVKALGPDHAAADSNGDGVLEIGELYGYLRFAVARDTKGEQTPWFARNKMVGDFAVF